MKVSYSFNVFLSMEFQKQLFRRFFEANNLGIFARSERCRSVGQTILTHLLIGRLKKGKKHILGTYIFHFFFFSHQNSKILLF
jgi:hypothetical protein